MKSPILFLLAIVSLTNGARENALADDYKRGVDPKRGTSHCTPEVKY